MTEESAPQAYLLSLPPELLTPIFQQANISLSNLIICRALLPYTLHALLVEVDLYSQAQIRSFHRTVLDDDKARLVRVLTMSTVKDRDTVRDEESSEEDSEESGSSGSEWESTDEEDEASKPLREAKVVQEEQQQYTRYEVAEALPSVHSSSSTELVVFSDEEDSLPFDEVLTDMVRRLVNLELCSAIGKDVACLFKDDFHLPGILPNLVQVYIQLQPSDEFTEEDHPLFIAASRFPTLEHLDVTGTCEGLPLDLSAFSTINPSKRPIPSHSWGLKSLTLNRVWMFGPEMRYLFSSFNQLQCLAIDGYQADPSFSQSLSLLPNTLQNLTITLLGDPDAGASLPTLDYLPLWFPNLEHLHLTGFIFTHLLFHHLHLAPKLRCLLFGHDAPINTSTLLRLVDPRSPLRIPTLHFLNVHLCWRMTGDANGRPLDGGVKKPIWTDEVSKKGARKLARMCREVGVDLDGGVACALKVCMCEKRGVKCQRRF
ncbi:hypothetical protein BCR35DRAFT_336499 [Leucosporidium creatinivorum]|uniref:F-box domain-containing protein n=1 Tax=Leucosporidium creatinivorum TaxID=106004 RepID=A0A1Y2C0L2_9BASI|nr:hypothetical protein BCR35DRAFT_336499 [Leucosporidium creatinivorum]